MSRKQKGSPRAAKRPTSGRTRAKDVEVPVEPVSTGDLRDQLRKDIVSCELVPGQRLKFEELRTRYDAGIGSLREALVQLEADGLVVAESNRGFCVAPVTMADLEDITQLRVEIETSALTQSIQNGNDAWEAGIVAALHMLAKVEPEASSDRVHNLELWYERHERFHSALVAGCRSPWLLRFRQILFVQSQRYRALSMMKSPKPGRMDDHRTLADLVVARDVPKATATMADHIRRTAANAREWLAAHGSHVATTEFTHTRDSRRQSTATTSEIK